MNDKTEVKIMKHGKIKLIKMKCHFCDCIFKCKPGHIIEKYCAMGQGNYVKITECPECGKEASEPNRIGPRTLEAVLGL